MTGERSVDSAQIEGRKKKRIEFMEKSAT